MFLKTVVANEIADLTTLIKQLSGYGYVLKPYFNQTNVDRANEHLNQAISHFQLGNLSLAKSEVDIGIDLIFRNDPLYAKMRVVYIGWFAYRECTLIEYYKSGRSKP